MTAKKLILGLLILFIQGFVSGQLRVHDIPKSNPNFTWTDFTIEMPEPGCKVLENNQMPQMVAFDFFLNSSIFSSVNLYSIEWAFRTGMPSYSEEEAYAKMEAFAPEYLSKNFGKGHYSLVFKARTHFQSIYPALYYIGTGEHNDGSKGSIYVIAVYMRHHNAYMYALKGKPLAESAKSIKAIEELHSLPDYEHFEKWALSLKYTGKEEFIIPTNKAP